MRVFLEGRLVALEQEHFGYRLLVDGADDDQTRAQWQRVLDATERSIMSFREGLASL